MKKMKLYINLIKYLSGIVLISISSACQAPVEEPIIQESIHTYNLNINCPKPSYDGEPTRSTANWQNGDKLFIYFKAKSEVQAIAEYTDGVWNIETIDDLEITSSGTCYIWYLDGSYTYTINGSSPKYLLFNCLPTCCMYFAESEYIIESSGDISIDTNLKPTLSRIRFQGEKDQQIAFKGFKIQSEEVKSYTNYNLTTDNSEYEGYTISCTEEIEGRYYSPYIYGYFPVIGKSGFISIKVEDKVYARNDIFAEQFSKVSKTIICPTESNHDNWRMDTYRSQSISIPENELDSNNNSTIESESFKSNTGYYINGNLYWTLLSDESYSCEIWTRTSSNEAISLMYCIATYYHWVTHNIQLRDIYEENIEMEYYIRIKTHNLKTNSTTFNISNF